MNDKAMASVTVLMPEVGLGNTLPGHPPELSDSVKLLLLDGSNYVFEIDLVLKSIL